ncbi:MAG: HAD-IIA family hydrolase [Anaerolineae bacterium]
MRFSTIAAVVMDMDGVLWRGNESLPGLIELFEWLHEAGVPYALATNNSSRTPADYVTKLARLGVPDVPERSIVTSGTATAAYLQTRYMPGTRVLVVGMEGLRQMIADAGFDVEEDDSAPVDVVVAGVDFELTYARLKQATLLIRGGADFVGTNPDKTFPAPEGLVPGAGSIIAALQAATDVTPVMIGKPGEPMFRTALDVLGTAPANTLMIGDRVDTDIAGAQAVGMQTALVFTGVTTPESLTSSATWPDVAYEGLPELLKAWAGEAWYRTRMKAKRGQA